MSFLTRWSRLKHKSATEKPATPAKEAEATAAAELPPVESLTFESDFAAYLRANVAESVKRAALKKSCLALRAAASRKFRCRHWLACRKPTCTNI